MGLPQPILTEDEYLTLERAALDRHQYVDGEIFAMAGESSAHGDITWNVNGILYNQLRGSPCRARIKGHQGPQWTVDTIAEATGRPLFLSRYRGDLRGTKVP